MRSDFPDCLPVLLVIRGGAVPLDLILHEGDALALDRVRDVGLPGTVFASSKARRMESKSCASMVTTCAPKPSSFFS